MAEAAAFSVLGKVLEELIAPIGRQLGYVFFYNGNVKNMKSQSDQLEAKKSAVELLVDAGKNNSEVVGPDIELWLKRVDEEKEATNLLLAGIEKVGKGCFNQWCLHLKSRYKLSKKALKCTQDLHLLLDGGDFPRVSYPPPSLAKVPSRKPGDASDLDLSANSSKGIHSRFVVAGDVIKALKDDKVWMIGVSGMGGVGKTTLVEEVSEWAKREYMFNEIVNVVVSKDAVVKNIQRDIAELLQLTFPEESLKARADRLRERLGQEGDNGQPKRVLIVLDDLWKRLDLKEVGIPFGEHHKGCKILLTSRNKNVFLEMRADRIFSLQLLTPEESMSLFSSSLGNDNHLYPIADSIVEECAGLPLAITTIAMALIEKEESTWQYVHNQLKKSVPEEEYNIVYTTFQLSYEFIEKEEIKRLFLLCSLFPEDAEIPIEELVRYAVGLNVLKKPYKLQEEREKVAFCIEKLKSSNLLLSNEQRYHVRMHDLVRDFGISISEQFMVRFYDDMIKTWPVEEIDKNLTSISLQCSAITDELPSGLQYQNLRLLRLTNSSKDLSLKFSESFFDGMSQLQVLYCRRMSIPKLPGSIELLLNLRTLSLTNCRIKFDVSLLSKLQNLEILSFSFSDIITLPKEIGYLSRLRLLDFTGCRELESIAPGVLSSLVRLEELYLRCDKFRWSEECAYDSDDDEEVPSYPKDNPSIDELNKLPNLVVLDGYLSSEILGTNLPFLRLLNKFRISNKRTRYGEYESELDHSFCNTLNIGNFRTFQRPEVNSVVKAMCVRIENLTLTHVDLMFLADGFGGGGGGGYTQLRSLDLRFCINMSYIFGNPDNPNLFPNLQSLEILSMHNFEDIFSGQSFIISLSSSLHQLAPFANLRELDISDCGEMKSMCTVSIARGLKELRSLRLACCSSMVEVFTKDKEDTDSKIILPRLESLSLEELDKFIGFCKSIEEIELPLLQDLELDGLPMITSIFSNKETLPLHSEDAASQNHSLFIKEVNLPRLAYVNIRNMENMKTIFNLQSAEAYPELKSLCIYYLPKLKHVWSNGSPDIVHQPAPNLRSLDVSWCSSLTHLFNVGEKEDDKEEEEEKKEQQEQEDEQDSEIKEQLEEESKNEVEMDEEKPILLPGLVYLELESLPELSRITPKNYTLNWSSIEELSVTEEIHHMVPAKYIFSDE